MLDREEVTATFHDAHRLDGFVRHLVQDDLVAGRRVHVARRAISRDGRSVPDRRLSRSVAGGALLGAAVMMALLTLGWGFAVVVWHASPLWFAWRLVGVGLATGALGGALLSLIASSAHATDASTALLTGDYLVRVDAPDHATADRVRTALDEAGGELLPA